MNPILKARVATLAGKPDGMMRVSVESIDGQMISGTFYFDAPPNFCRIGDTLTLTVDPPSIAEQAVKARIASRENCGVNSPAEPVSDFDRCAALAMALREVCAQSGLGASAVRHALDSVERYSWLEEPPVTARGA